MDNKQGVVFVNNEGITNGGPNSLSSYFSRLPPSRCSQQYETRLLTQSQQLYEICVKVKNQIRADGPMSLLTKNNQGRIVKISIKTLSKYNLALYKCEKSANLHLGVVLENRFTINEEYGRNYDFTHCLVHSYVTSDTKKAQLKFEFKNNSDFSKELGFAIGSDNGIYLMNNQKISDRSATAQVLQTFAENVVNRPFGIYGNINCSHLVACLNFILAGENYTNNDERRYQKLFDELPDEIQQLFTKY